MTAFERWYEEYKRAEQEAAAECWDQATNGVIVEEIAVDTGRLQVTRPPGRLTVPAAEKRINLAGL